MSDPELDKARKAWGEELLLQRESELHLRNVRISELEYQVTTLEEKAKELAQQNALFKAKYPYTAYAIEITALKTIIDTYTNQLGSVDELTAFRNQTISELTRQLGSARDYFDELYRLNPGLKLPNGKQYEPDEPDEPDDGDQDASGPDPTPS